MKGDGTSLYWKQRVQARPQTSFLLLDVKKHLFLLCSRQQVPPSVSIESSMLGTEGLLSAMNNLCRNHHPSVTRPAMEALNALARCKIGAVAISKDDFLLSALVESVPSASSELPSDTSSIVQQTTVQTIIVLVMNNDSFAAIVTQRDTFVKILMVLASFGCGKSGKIELRNEAMKAVAQLAEHL